MRSSFTTLLRIVLGIVLLVFGLNKILPFSFLPTMEFSPEATDFMASLKASGYVLAFIGLLEIIIAILLLMRKWIPFALILLAPISINILLFHIFLDSGGLVLALIVVLLNGFLMYKYWRHYRVLFY